MPFTTDYTDIANYKDVIYETVDGEIRVKTRAEAIIWAMPMLGFTAITEANAEAVYARIAMYELLFGALVRYWPDGVENPVDQPMKPEHIREMIGLRTNVSNESQTRWLSRMTKSRIQDFEREYQRDTK